MLDGRYGLVAAKHRAYVNHSGAIVTGGGYALVGDAVSKFLKD